VKIAILSSFYPYRGGIAQFNANIFEELGKNHEVKAFNFKRQYPDLLFPGKTQYVEKEDTAIKVQSTSILDTANPFSYIRTARAIREWEPDLLIMRYWMSYFAPSLGYVGRHQLKKTKVISVLDNVIPHEQHFFDKPFTKYFLGANDAFIVLSDAVGRDLLSYKPNAKFISTPHPLYNHFGEKMDREKAIEKIGIEKGKKNILFFGLIREYKGLDILIEAFSGLDDSFQLIVAGEPYGSFDRYRQLIDNSPNKERIKLFNGYISDSDVPAFFSASDICVLPYRSATQSGISAISLHFGLPMITTDVGGLREAIEGPGTGIVVKQPDASLIRDAIVDYFENDRISYFEKNISIEKSELSWSKFCNKLTEFYKTL
jgi:glycosyltransferase involved in cell wall biosynthesis